MKKLTLAKFRRDEDGSITAFLLVIFLIMVVSTGMAVDFMRHEAERVVFQDVLDRAVLATTSFDSAHQTEEDISDVIRSHMTAAGYDLDYVNDLQIYPTVTAGYRRVDVSANFEIRTFFLRIMNKPTLTLAARATAETKRSELELSLVVDVSGSMSRHPQVCVDVEGYWYEYYNRRGQLLRRWIDASTACEEDTSQPTKIVSLQASATTFMELLLADEDDVSSTSISLIPFSAQVNPGEDIAAQFTGLNKWHDYSYCFEMEDADFTTTDMTPTLVYEQGQSWWPREQSEDFRWCPREANKITAFSNDLTKLNGAIADLTIEQYTSIWMGAKWGAAMLDPSMAPVITGLTNTADSAGGSVVSPNFAGRPAAWNSSTVKYLVIMTDGDNTLHRTIEPEYFNHFGTDDWRTQENADYWEGAECDVNRVCTFVDLSDEDRGFFYGDGNSGYAQSKDSDGNLIFPEETIIDIDNRYAPNEGFGDDRLHDLCEAAKTVNPTTNSNRIIVYTIGFDIQADSLAADALLDCASEPTKYFLADDAQALDDAFRLIAASIQKLKLVVN